MYILQFVNSFTQETLREAKYDSPNIIHKMIRAFEKSSNINHPTYIFDNFQRPLNAEYLFKTVNTDGKNTLYKLYFIVKFADDQAVVE